MNLSTFSVAALITLTGCAGAIPVSENLNGYSNNYSGVMAEFANQDILQNTLRARDGRPLHFAELSQINGSLQTQVSLNVSVPFGPYVAVTKSTNSVGGGYQFQSSPSFTTSPLDTQAFQVGLLQPIDPSYIASLWNWDEPQAGRTPADGVSNQVIIQLLVKAIYIPTILLSDDKNICTSHPSKCGEDGKLRGDLASTDMMWLTNQPGQPDWEYFIASIVPTLKFKTFTVLVPIGAPFEISTKVTTGYNNITPDKVSQLADEVTIHLGIEKASAENPKTHVVSPTLYRLYRRWDSQPGVCVNSTSTTPIKIPPPSTSSYGLETVPSKSPGGGAGNPQSAGGGKQSTGVGSIQPTPTVPLISVFDNDEKGECKQTVIKLKDSNVVESEIDTQATNFQIRIRSIQEVFEYLGRALKLNFQVSSTSNSLKVPLFALKETVPGAGNLDGEIQANYSGKTFYIDNLPDQSGYTKPILSLLHQLINANKLSSDIPTTKQVLVIP